jgi:hypothetical protein
VIAAYGATIRMWDPDSGDPIWPALTGRDYHVESLLWTELPEGPLVVSGQRDGGIGLWDLSSGEQIDDFRPGRTAVNALAWTMFQGRPWVISGDATGWLHATELYPKVRRRRHRLIAERKFAINALACGTIGGRPHVVAGDTNQRLSTFTLDGHEVGSFALPVPANAIAAHRSGLVVGYGSEVALLTQARL